MSYDNTNTTTKKNLRDYFLVPDLTNFYFDTENDFWIVPCKQIKKKAKPIDTGIGVINYDSRNHVDIDFNDVYDDSLAISKEDGALIFNSGIFSSILEHSDEVDDWVREHFISPNNSAIKGFLLRIAQKYN